MRRLFALTGIAALLLTACGGNDSDSTTDIATLDSVAEKSEQYCEDLTSFLKALEGIPSETPEATAKSIEDFNNSLEAMRESNPEGLNVDYDSIESVTKDIIDLLADYGNDAAAVEADLDGAKRLTEIQTGEGNMDGFMILGSYYQNNCGPVTPTTEGS